MKVVLVIGEKPQQVNALAERLGLLGVEAIPCARDRELAVGSLTAHDVSLVLLDVDDSEDSLAFFEALKDISDVPVLARGKTGKTDNVVFYLESGAAGFVAKTATPPVLAARIQALLRSVQSSGRTSASIEIGGISIDLRRQRVTKGTVEVSLTLLEYRLLIELAANKGGVCGHKDLLKNVWGEDFTRTEDLHRYVKQLRQKLEDNPRHPRMLMNARGRGYRLVEPKAATPTSASKRASDLLIPDA